MKKLLVFFAILILLASGALFLTNIYIESSLQAVDPDDETKIIVDIPNGSTTSSIGEILKDNNLISNATVFKYYAKKTKLESELKAGSYVFSRDMDIDSLLSVLTKGVSGTNTKDITLVEGLTMEEAAKSISEQLNLDYEVLVEDMSNVDRYRSDYDFLKDNPNISNLQGYLLPNTYNVYKNSSENDIVEYLISQFDEFYVDELKPLLQNADISFEEVINLASIVEKEALLDKERGDIAAVFLNRLDIDMKLQSCATVNYAHGEWKENLTYEDLEIDSPYNTYIYKGLPPAPINSPGRLSILAVLNPTDVDYLYFLAKGDGSHYFSETYEDFLEAKEKYLTKGK
jgi:UPF0755 protein